MKLYVYFPNRFEVTASVYFPNEELCFPRPLVWALYHQQFFYWEINWSIIGGRSTVLKSLKFLLGESYSSK